MISYREMSQEAKGLFEESLALWRALGSQRGIANTLSYLGFFLIQSDPDTDRAVAYAQESLAIRRQIDERLFLAEGIFDLAGVSLGAGQFDQAHTLYLEAISLLEELGIDSGSYILNYVNFGIAKVSLGEYQEAKALLLSCLAQSREVGHQYSIGLTLEFLGAVSLALGQPDEAYDLLRESLAVFREIQTPDQIATTLAMLSLALIRQSKWQQAQASLLEAIQTNQQARGIFAWLYTLSAVALLLIERGNPEWAVELYALASTHPHVANSRWFEDIVGQSIAALADSLSPAVFSAARQRGQSLELWEPVDRLWLELTV